MKTKEIDNSARITYEETSQILNDILDTFKGVELTEDEKYDLIVTAMGTVVNNPEVNFVKPYIKATLINNLRDKIKAHMYNVLKED